MQAARQDTGSAQSPTSGLTVAVAFYPPETGEADVARHARDFAIPHGPIATVLVRRHEAKGPYAVVRFQTMSSAAAAVAQERASPVGSHLPRIYLWTPELEASNFNGTAFSDLQCSSPQQEPDDCQDINALL